MDKRIAAFILSYIEERLVNCENPRQYGKALQDGLDDKWRYRVGDYMILAKIEDDKVNIIIVEIGHQKDIYTESNIVLFISQNVAASDILLYP